MQRVPPGGLTRTLRFILVATPLLFALSAPTTLDAQKVSERNRAPAVRCPNISLCCRTSVRRGLLGPFIATLGETGGVTPSFNWKVSAGQVAAGQGTAEIVIDTKGLQGRAVLATVEVGGYGPRCSATCVAEVPDPRGVDSRGARLTTLSVSVKSSRDGRPVPRAKINVYRDGAAVGGQAETDARGQFARGGWTPGAYRVEAVADRFERRVSGVTLDSSTAGAVVLSLNPIAAPPTPTPTTSPSPTLTATPLSGPPVAVVTPTPSPTPGSQSLLAKQFKGPDLPWLAFAALAALAAAGYLLSKKFAAGAAGGTLTAPAERTLGAAAGTTKQADEVHCTVFAPPAARPGSMLKVQAFAHLVEQAQLLAGLAAERAPV